MKAAEQLLRLFSYDMWASEQILLSLQENLPFEKSEECINAFAHLSAAQQIWYSRVVGKSDSDLELWPDYGLPEALQNLKTLSGKWKRLIRSNSGELSQAISYRNSSGDSFNTPLADILHHVVIHGQHHRAQIAQLLRNAKISPPATDFIFFSRAN